MVGNFPGALAQINVLLSVFFAGISGSSTADAASQGKIFIEAQVKEGYDLSLLDRDHGGVGGAGGDHPAVDPDGRLGRRAAGVDRRAVPRRRDPGAADRPRADGHRPRLREGPPLPDLSARDAQGVLHAPPRSRSRR